MSSFPKLQAQGCALMSKSIIRIFLVISSFLILGQVFSQNVGIGTLIPEDPLHLIGNMRISGGRIVFVNTGQSVFIGLNAGLNDDLTDNKNVYVGYESGKSNINGSDNSFLGYNAGLSNTVGNNNTAIGANALKLNASGGHNVVIGRDALSSSTSGSNHNVVIGNEALRLGTSIQASVAVGRGALEVNSNVENVAIGYISGQNATGKRNTFLGYATGQNNTGDRNVFLGHNAGRYSTGNDRLYIDNSDTGNPLLFGEFDLKRLTINDTLITERLYMTEGASAGYVLRSNASGRATWVNPSTLSSSVWSISGNDIYKNNSGNVGIGIVAPIEKLHVKGTMAIDSGRVSMLNTGQSIFVGDSAGFADDLSDNRNVFVGHHAGRLSVTGMNNVALGYQALNSSIAADSNVAVGYLSGASTTGNANTFLGFASGLNNLNGTGNVFLGALAGINETGSDKLYISNSDDNTPLLYGEFDQNRLTINDTLLTERLYLTEGAADGYLLKSNSSGKAIWANPGTLFNNVWSISGNDIYKNNTGNVGIGTSTPGEKLEVVGNVKINAGKLSFTNSGNSVFIGEGAGSVDNLTNNRNVFVGFYAGAANTDGVHNVAIGNGALTGSTNSNYNTAIGSSSLVNSGLTGQRNTAAGFETLLSNTTGEYNTAIGTSSLKSNTTGVHNVALGTLSLQNNTSGGANVAIGSGNLTAINGLYNTSVGFEAGFNKTSGDNNAFFGRDAGRNNLTGSNNVFLGYSAGYNESGSNKLYISNSSTSAPLIHGDFATGILTVNAEVRTQRVYLTEGAVNGYILKSDASGKGSWVNPSTLINNMWSISGNDIYKSNSGNVGMGTSSPSEMLDVVGNIKINSGRLSMVNANQNIFIGENVGQANTSGDNNNIIGFNALTNNTTGHSNVALGNNALFSLTSGFQNTAVGHDALKSGISSTGSVALGYQALFNNNASDNVAVGFRAGSSATGSINTFVGTRSGQNNTGNANVFLGYEAGVNATGSNKLYISNSSTSTPLLYGEFDTKILTVNDTLISKTLRINSGKISFLNTGKSVFIGEDAGKMDDLTENQNIFIGYYAGRANITGSSNLAIGNRALNASNNSFNVAIGNDALASASLTGLRNTALGIDVLKANTTGGWNVGVGSGALEANTTGFFNIAIGTASLFYNTTGSSNVVIGRNAMLSHVTGDFNASIGQESGYNNISGSGNIFLGFKAGYNETGSNKLYIENTDSSTPLIYGDFGANRVGINKASPISTFEVAGSQGATIKNGQTAGTHHPDETALIWRYVNGSGMITLPAAGNCPNRMYVIINHTGAGRDITSFINLLNALDTIIEDGSSITIISDGTGWFQIK